MKHSHLLLLILSFGAAVGCSEAAPEKPPFSIRLSATSDEGQPLPGVSFSTGEKLVGTTPESGGFVVQLRGAEGATLPLQAKCPEQYESPLAGSIRLTRVKALSGTPEPLSFDAVCSRKVRDVVVVVHAENGAGLPVSIDGEESGTTDEHGNAHVLVSVDREVKTLAVSLDTSEHERLRPQNPRRVFELDGHDAVALFHQPLSQARAPRKARPVSRAPRHVPYRVK